VRQQACARAFLSGSLGPPGGWVGRSRIARATRSATALRWGDERVAGDIRMHATHRARADLWARRLSHGMAAEPAEGDQLHEANLNDTL